MLEYNNLKKLINDPDNDEVPYMVDDNAENTGSLENDKIDTTMINRDNIVKPEEDEIVSKLKDNPENTDTAIKSNNENSKSELNRSNSLPEGLNKTSTRCSWAEETQKTDILRELLREDSKKMEIIEDMVKERQRLETKLRNKDEIIQNLIIGMHEEEINIEKSFNKETQIRDRNTRIKEIKWQLDIKNIKIRDICDEVGDLLSELNKLENPERPLEYNRKRENKFQNQTTDNIDIYQVSSGSNKTRDNNYQNNYKTHEGREHNWRKLPCRLHGPGHTAGECKTACGFCWLKGSHTGENCRKKNEKIDQFIYIYIQKFGITAKATAEKFIRPDRIIHPSDEEFEKIWKEESRVQ